MVDNESSRGIYEPIYITKSYRPPTPPRASYVPDIKYAPYIEPEGLLTLDSERQMYIYKPGFMTCTNGKLGYLASLPMAQESYQYAFFATRSYLYDKQLDSCNSQFLFVPGENDTVRLKYNPTSYLAVNPNISGDTWQWAFFGTSVYLDTIPHISNFKLITIEGRDMVRIQCSESSYLAVDTISNYQYAFFATQDYLDSHPTYCSTFSLSIS